MSARVCTQGGDASTAGASGGGGGGTAAATGDLCKELQGLSSCNASQCTAKELPASALFLVDRSASMDCDKPTK